MIRRKGRIPDEELDWAIREALHAETEGLEPSPAVWQRICAEIQKPTQAERPIPRRLTARRRAASLLQGAILALLVLGVGLSFSQSFLGHDLLIRRPTAQHTEARAPAHDDLSYPEDMLNVRYLNHLAQQPEPGEWRLMP